MFQPVLRGRVLEKLQRILDLLLVQLGRRAFAEGHAETVA